MKDKQLVITFIKQDDGSVVTTLKDTKDELSAYELFMAFTHLKEMLDKTNFDWNKVGTIAYNLRRRDGNGK